jgi:hypothetical protein
MSLPLVESCFQLAIRPHVVAPAFDHCPDVFSPHALRTHIHTHALTHTHTHARARAHQVAQVREQMELEKKLKHLASEIALATAGGKQPDEDLTRSHTLAVLDVSACSHRRGNNSIQQFCSNCCLSALRCVLINWTPKRCAALRFMIYFSLVRVACDTTDVCLALPLSATTHTVGTADMVGKGQRPAVVSGIRGADAAADDGASQGSSRVCQRKRR